MLLCTAYLTATLVSFGAPGISDKMDMGQKQILCPMIDAPMALASLPEVQRISDRFAANVSASFYASLAYAASCPKPENCKLAMPPAQRK